MTLLLKDKKGFSFIEMMTTIAVLSLGIVAVYQSFFKSLGYVNHMTYRLCALNIISSEIELIQKRFEVTGEIVLTDVRPKTVQVHGHPIEFTPYVDLASVNNKENIYQLNIALSWNESGRQIVMSRSCYIYHDNPKSS